MGPPSVRAVHVDHGLRQCWKYVARARGHARTRSGHSAGIGREQGPAFQTVPDTRPDSSRYGDRSGRPAGMVGRASAATDVQGTACEFAAARTRQRLDELAGSSPHCRNHRDDQSDLWRDTRFPQPKSVIGDSEHQ